MGKLNSAVVVGAGIGGLATACLLAKQGVHVTVVEKNLELGGRVGILEEQGFRWDVGPSWYLMPEAFDRFFELTGTSTAEQLDLVTLDPGYRMFFEQNGSVDVPHGTDAVAQLFESIEPGAGRKVREYLRSADSTYQLALRKFLYTNFRNPKILWDKDVLANRRLLYTSLRKFVDGQFTDHRLRKVLQFPAMFLSSQPKRIPALYHLMSHADLNLGVQYPMGGFQMVVQALERLARQHGVTFLLGQEVTKILTKDRQVMGVAMIDQNGTPSSCLANVVISNADMHHIEKKLLAPVEQTYPNFQHNNPGISAVLVMLGIKTEIPELLHHNLFISKDWDEDFAAIFPNPTTRGAASESFYVCRPSATDPTVAPPGSENLFIMVPTPADPIIGHGNAYREQESPQVQAIARRTIHQLSQTIDRPSLTDDIVMHRTIGPQDFAERYYTWQGGALGPSHTLAQSAMFRHRNRSAKIAGLYYVGSSTVPGVGVPMCLISAENVVARLF